MSREKAIVVFKYLKDNEIKEVDIEVPLFITGIEFINALNIAYELGINTQNIKNYHFSSKNPIALIRGNRTLAEFGVRNGSVIQYWG